MRILLTGANGYIGKRLLPVLLQEGHQIVALVRLGTLDVPESFASQLTVIAGDLLNPNIAALIEGDVDIAYYLVHSMSDTDKDFEDKESRVAKAFNALVIEKHVKQVIYLSGLTNEGQLSRHLTSRLNVEKILSESGIPLTILKAGIIIGSGSASFEIIRDLVEILPVMVAPKWINNLCQPISIYDVIYYLTHVLNNEKCFNKTYEIGGPEVVTFRAMLEGVAKVRGLKRYIFSVPVLTPRLSSYWLYFVTSTNFALAKSLVESMRNNTIKKDMSIDEVLPHPCLTYEEAVRRSYSKIEENAVISSWKDNWNVGSRSTDLNDYIKVPEHGCLSDVQHMPFQGNESAVVDKIWSIGGNHGWYYMDWAWEIRGFLDKLAGGVGLRRGRRDPTHLQAGDALDYWRVVLADKKAKRLLLYAEMKLPGEAWLEFHVVPKDDGQMELIQTATFRPHGILGRIYWYSMFPFHIFIFKGMAQQITEASKENHGN